MNSMKHPSSQHHMPSSFHNNHHHRRGRNSGKAASVSPPAIDFSVNDVVFEKKRPAAEPAPVDWSTNDVCFKDPKPWKTEADYYGASHQPYGGQGYGGAGRRDYGRYSRRTDSPGRYRGQDLYYSQRVYGGARNYDGGPSMKNGTGYYQPAPLQYNADMNFSQQMLCTAAAAVAAANQYNSCRRFSKGSLGSFSDISGSSPDNSNTAFSSSSYNFQRSASWNGSSSDSWTATQHTSPQHTSSSSSSSSHSNWNISCEEPSSWSSSHNYLPQYTADMWSDSTSLLELARQMDSLDLMAAQPPSPTSADSSGLTGFIDFSPLAAFKAEQNLAPSPEKQAVDLVTEVAVDSVTAGCSGNDEQLNSLVDQIITE